MNVQCWYGDHNITRARYTLFTQVSSASITETQKSRPEPAHNSLTPSPVKTLCARGSNALGWRIFDGFGRIRVRHITLITGGSRSGKSRFALEKAQQTAGPHTFIATCPALDGEMTTRIRRHQAERDGRWQTVEEQTELATCLAGLAQVPVILIDCLTLWVNNLIYHGGLDHVNEDTVAAAAQAVLHAATAQKGRLLLVTNETGLGVMPANPLARRFSDCAGRCNQIMAAAADEVVFMVSGLPLYLKGGPS